MKGLTVFALAAVLLTSCAVPVSDKAPDPAEVTCPEQSPGQLGIEPQKGRTPLNYSYVTGKWLPYIRYEEMMYGRSADEFRSAVREWLAEAVAEGVNTVYLHVHPCGDAYYRSELFPKGVCLDGDYDPLVIMLEEAHALAISAHAWINPLRCQTAEQMRELPGSYTVKKWADDPDCAIVKEVGGRWYLDPAYQETDELLVSCINEIAGNYDVDGFHIDDYFYPTADPEFDTEEFAGSGASDLAEWRMSNCSRMVRAMYCAVKSHDSRLQFGISPQGSLRGNYESQFADVRLWCRGGYCDYIVPQIYFGFLNESCPFAEVLAEWEKMKGADVRLIIGLAEYKTGREDIWAGAAGEREWIDCPDIIERQISLVRASAADGYALYE